MNRTHVTGLVLAAGRSTRMGHDKARVDLAGEPALARILRLLREAEIDRIVAVLAPVGPEMRAAVDLAGVTVAVNADRAAGQTASIRIGAKNVPTNTDAVLLCPVDVPLFEVDDVRAVVDAPRPAGTTIVVPSVDGRRGHPALFARETFAEFGSLADDAPGHEVVRRDPARVLHVERRNPWLVRDLDTPEDLAAARESLTGR